MEPTQTPEKVADMSLRDFFAAKAMSGLLAYSPLTKFLVRSEMDGDAEATAHVMAKGAYVVADAMMATRNKEEAN